MTCWLYHQQGHVFISLIYLSHFYILACRDLGDILQRIRIFISKKSCILSTSVTPGKVVSIWMVISCLPAYLFVCHSILFMDNSPVWHKSVNTPQWLQPLIQSASPRLICCNLRFFHLKQGLAENYIIFQKKKSLKTHTSKQTGEPVSKLLFSKLKKKKTTVSVVERAAGVEPLKIPSVKHL